MHIVQISPEMVPFAKTGGLADVAGALPKTLKGLKQKVSCFMPLYKQVKDSTHDLVSTDIRINIKIGDQMRSATVWRHTTSDKIDVYFIQNDEYYHRDYLYSTPQGDYWDNAERFIFFCRAVLEAIKLLNLKPDIIHCHDWQTGLIPVYVRTLYKKDFPSVKTVITIHNMAYQGVFWHWDMKLTGLDWSLFNWKQMEFWGKMNLLKGGLVFVDALTTVSPRYAQEIQTSEFGCGLEGVLKERAKNLFGIINGIDYTVWDPAKDNLLIANYSPNKLQGKNRNKSEVQRLSHLPERDVPLIGMITRLAEQKGAELVLEIFDELMKLDVQFVLLGTGDEKYHTAFNALSARYHGKAGIHIAFDNQLAHLITAGADMFLMPSKYEPCGLNQLYALKYGTVPIARETGGLADTISNYTTENANNATGFTFKQFTGPVLLNAIKTALSVYKDSKTWSRLMKNGMSQDWSWEHSAQEYLKIYKNLLS